ncbi:symporter YidK [Lederbergia lenta]|uniref:Symporter YidK n=3 Tax=Lederbergia lenta TaxID=1467 RepID=A0A2X4W692_LEDLE|nr:symporter YidK [Lederbergia lenta]
MQRAIAAKNLKEGQKGLLIAAFLKLLGPVFLILPGIIAFNLLGDKLNPINAYSAFVNHVLPTPLVGFLAAVLFGAILSSFNSGLNSTVTLLMLNVYKPYMKPNMKDPILIRHGKVFGTIIALFSMLMASLIDLMPQGFFQYLQMVNGFYNVPIFTILIVGYSTKRVQAIAAKVSLGVFITVYAITQLFWDTGLHYLHILAILFVVCIILILVIGKIKPCDTDFVLEDKKAVELTPWKLLYPVGFAAIALMIIVYSIFSSAGIAN